MSKPVSAPSRPVSAVIFLSELERDWFYPNNEFLGLTERGLAVHWLPSPQSSDEWMEILEKFQPEVIAGAWTMRGMPLVCLAPEGPVRYLCQISGSVRHVITAEHIRRGLLVSNWGNLPAKAVAELALMHAIACQRRIAQQFRNLYVDRIWSQELDPGHTLFGKKVGIHGYGRIARELIDFLKPFDVDLRVFAPGVPAEVFRAAGITACPDLDALCHHSEVFFELEGLTERSRSSVSGRHLALLKDGASFINVARAHIVEEEALLKEAVSGRLQIALDVYYDEPLSKESPWRDCRNVLLSPHIGGPTLEQRADAGRISLANMVRYACGEVVLHQVDLKRFEIST
ncbi:MAG: NAD(P)-dependent oxidoreductase [Opitutaceae bacterium]